ncbi:hypothetical protein H4R19_003905, partial [Coemansia spiralis]
MRTGVTKTARIGTARLARGGAKTLRASGGGAEAPSASDDESPGHRQLVERTEPMFAIGDAQPLQFVAAKAAGLKPGVGPAGVKRFPSIGDVFNAQRAKRKFAESPDIPRAFDMLDRLRSVLAVHATPHAIVGLPGNHQALSLRAAVRLLRAKERADGCSEHMRVSEMVRLVQLVDRGPPLAVWLAQKRTDPDGSVKIHQMAINPLPPPVKSSWMVVRDKRSHQLQDSATMLRQAMPERYLPDLASVGDIQLEPTHPQLPCQYEELISLYSEWRAGGPGSTLFPKLEAAIRKAGSAAPNGFIKSAEMFGSRLYNVCRKDSDIDVAVTVRSQRKGWLSGFNAYGRRFAQALQKQPGIRQAVWVSTARVPIVKFTMVKGGETYSGDIVFNNALGLAKSKMLTTYMETDPRVRPFMTLLKHWSQARLLANSSTLNSFGIMLMGLAFLISERVVPPLQLLSTVAITDDGWQQLLKVQQSPALAAELYTNPRCIETGKELPKWEVEGHPAFYFSTPHRIAKWRSPNKAPPLVLLFEMFKFYGTRFDPVHDAVSPRLGSPCVPRNCLSELHAPSPEVYLPQPQQWSNNLCLLAIEDPFELARNTAKNVPPAWALGLLWEMRRGALAIAESLNDQTSVLTRLFMPPTEAIYPDAAVWAPVYTCLLDELQTALGEAVFDKERDVRPENTIDLS